MFQSMSEELEDLRAYKALAVELANRKGYDSLAAFFDDIERRKTDFYTVAITKVFSPNRLMDLGETSVMARAAGYDLFEHNGIVWLVNDPKDAGSDHVATSFLIRDFKVSKL